MRFHHFGLEVTNLEDSVSFYKKYLGFQEECRFFFLEDEIVFLTSGDFRIELISTQSEEKHAHLCFEVTNLTEIIDRLGADRIAEGPYTLQNGWETIFYEGPTKKDIIEFLQIKPVI
ncbi:VOC family protein [Neobacillus drentensis]|uniref:VOC family protein n=1 Tax=Neobacillus drentensis TaxID=220684 RepID=UPI002FFE54C6